MLGLYLHIPFCQAICSYCNFNRGLLDEALEIRYVAALEREVREAGDGRPVDTIFFGGGTPSLLAPAEIATLIGACRHAYDISPDAEITLETNPETVTDARLAAFRSAGVTRVSLGVQSFDDRELQHLGRVHSALRAAEAVRAVRAAGVGNVSLDLMFWLPGQSRRSWLTSVEKAIDLEPDHLSFYLLELYPNAPLKDAMARGAWPHASDDEAADMYLEGLDRLDAAGFGQYEISNVAREGFASRHNLKYWTMGSWRGFGCGAHSTVDGVRWRNVNGTAEYADRLDRGQPVDVDRRVQSARERAEEAIFTGLRLTAGVDAAEFAARYGRSPWDTYGEDLARYVSAGLMWTSGTRFGLTRSGMLVSNEMLASFV